MQLSNTLRAFTAALTIMAALPSAQAENMTNDQRACVARVLKNSASTDTDADVKACLSAEGEGDPEKAKKELAPDSPEAQALLATLEVRLSKPSPVRPASVKFSDVKHSLEARPDLLFSLNEMENTGGQPDVVRVEGNTYIFADVSPESPKGRRNLDHDQAMAMAEKAGYEMMPPDVYMELQKKIRLDAHTPRPKKLCSGPPASWPWLLEEATWSWLLTTDAKIRDTGRAQYGTRDDLCDEAGIYRSDADRRRPLGGFRGLLRVPIVQ